MNKKLLILPLTAALLAACGSATPPAPVTLNTLTLSGVSGPLKIEAPAKLTVTATGSDGNPFSGTATFASSDPNVIAVAADGTLTVRHVSINPVTLTVTEAGKTASLDVKSYGLDFATGTYLASTGLVGTIFTIRYVDASGNGLAADAPLSIQGPAGYNKGAAITVTYPAAFGTRAGTVSEYSTAAVDGAYTATLTVGNTTFSKTATLDSKSLLGVPKDVAVNVTKTNVTLSGALPAGTARLSVNAFAASDNKFVTYANPGISTVPATSAWATPLNPGTYRFSLIASSYYSPSTAPTPLPDQANASYTFIPDVTLN